MNDFKIVSVCSKIPQENYYCLKEWVLSLKDNQPLILGGNEGEYGGLGSKPRLLYKAIMDGDIQEKYIIFCDCFDLIFATSPKDLFAQYKKLVTPIVVSAEKNCFPDDFKNEYDKLENGTSYKYLNSGMIVGETDAILTCLEAMDAPNIPNDYWDGEKMVNPNDQRYWQDIFLQQPVDISLDRYQVLCNTLHQVEASELEFKENGIIKNIECNTIPCSFHFNGGAKTSGLMNPILHHLNLL